MLEKYNPSKEFNLKKEIIRKTYEKLNELIAAPFLDKLTVHREDSR